MKSFSELIVGLDQTNKTNEKIKILSAYFEKAIDEDKIWALAILTGRKPKRTVNSTKLWEWANEKTSLPDWLFSECYNVVGDLAETIALLLGESTKTEDQSLYYYITSINSLGKADEETKKKFIQDAWAGFSYYEKFVFNKLITGNFRIGVSQKIVIKALSSLYKIDENQLVHQLMGAWSPYDISFKELILENHTSSDFSRPYPFHLAYALDMDLQELGDTKNWVAEWKWDGIRGQIIKRNETLFVWSRGEDLITEKFPEFNSLLQLLPEGTVIDGEILPFNNGKPMPFSALQTRIGRKNVTEKHLKEIPVSLVAYDLLEWKGEDMRNAPLEKRKDILEALIKVIASERLVISESIHFTTWSELTEIRTRSRDMLSEGIMLKKIDSPYETGRKRGSWWKWKIEPLTIDAVLIYAQKGHGRRANLYTDYTFAVWNNNILIPFAKAYSGLTDKEIQRVDNFIKKNTKEKFGPVRSVSPELVFEIAFEGINKSPRHKSGIALRFPRILRWREDKKAADADTLDHLKKMLEIYGS